MLRLSAQIYIRNIYINNTGSDGKKEITNQWNVLGHPYIRQTYIHFPWWFKHVYAAPLSDFRDIHDSFCFVQNNQFFNLIRSIAIWIFGVWISIFFRLLIGYPIQSVKINKI